MKKYCFVLLIPIIFFACSEAIDFKVEESEKKIVINSLITPDSLLKINLSKSLGVLEKDRDMKFISDADVSLFENDDFLEKLSFQINGYYHSTIYPKENNTYKIVITHPQLPAAEAQSTVPPKVTIDSINADFTIVEEMSEWYDYDKNQYYDTTFYFFENGLRINVSFTDPAYQKNYYLLTFTAYQTEYDYPPPRYEPVPIGKRMKALTYDIMTISEMNYWYIDSYEGYVFTDDLFNGKSHTVFADLSYEHELPESNLKVNLLSVSEEMFEYITSRNKYDMAIENPLAEPVNVYSNIKNGFGFFSAFSASTDSVIFYKNE